VVEPWACVVGAAVAVWLSQEAVPSTPWHARWRAAADKAWRTDVRPTTARHPQVIRLGCGGARPCCARAESGLARIRKGGAAASTLVIARESGPVVARAGSWGRARVPPLRVTCLPRRCPPPATAAPLRGRLTCLLPGRAGAAGALRYRCWLATRLARHARLCNSTVCERQYTVVHVLHQMARSVAQPTATVRRVQSRRSHISQLQAAQRDEARTSAGRRAATVVAARK